jgi:hypothetical protein
MATKKITELVELISAASGDVLPIVDISEDITKKIQVSNFPISTATQTAIDAKQDTLVSGINIKTINSTSLLGSGDVAVQQTLVSGTNIKTLNSESLLGSGNIEITASPAGVAGAIQFSDGSAFASDASNLFWDDTNKRLGVGINTPTARLHVKGSGSTSATTSLLVQNSAGTDVLKVTDDSVTNARGTLNVLHASNATRSLKLNWGSIFATDSASELILGAVFTVPSSPQILLAGNTRSSGANTMQLQASAGVSIATSVINPSAQLHVKGSGATSATTALLVENSAGTQTFKVLDNGTIFMGIGSGSSFICDAGGPDKIRTSSVGVGIDGSPVTSAALAVNGTSKGFLPPRMTTTQKNAISTPASGLMVYDTDTNKLCCYNGTSWNDLF